MIKTNNTGELIIISGTTCAGKGTIINKLLEENDNICLSTSYTSRPIRQKEVNGKDYYFVTREEFEAKIKNDEFLEYACVRYGEYFGTPKKEVIDLLNSGKDVILHIIGMIGVLHFPHPTNKKLLLPSFNNKFCSCEKSSST